MSDADHADLLTQSRERATKLVSDLRRQRDELAQGNPPSVTPESMTVGRLATDRLLASVERLLSSFESAATPDPEYPPP